MIIIQNHRILNYPQKLSKCIKYVLYKSQAIHLYHNDNHPLIPLKPPLKQHCSTIQPAPLPRPPSPSSLSSPAVPRCRTQRQHMECSWADNCLSYVHRERFLYREREYSIQSIECTQYHIQIYNNNYYYYHYYINTCRNY